MADVRTDDVIGAVEIRTEDFQAIKSIELFPGSFRVDDAKSEVEFADEATREELIGHISDAILALATHELTAQPRPAATR
jgi:hypothetical protein